MFTKVDLQLGMILENERGDLDIIIANQYELTAQSLYCSGETISLKHDEWFYNLTNDLKIRSPYAGGDIVKVYKDYTLKEVVWERKKEILDEVEKKWLKALLSLFKKYKVVKIVKHMELATTKLAYLAIIIENEKTMFLPDFEPSTMYKGMQFDIKYTLKELGL